MTIKKFTDSNEKAKLFGSNGYRQIKSVKELNAWLNSLHLDNDKLHWNFRGLNNASFRLYTSFQRFWAERHLDDLGMNPIDAIKNMIAEAHKSDNPLAKYYKALHVNANDWLILAFLQHYGAATPLLDFTRDPKVAFYFASLGACHTINPVSELENYVSVYYYCMTRGGCTLPTLTNVARSHKAKRAAELQSWLTFGNVINAIKGGTLIIIPSGSNGRLNKVIGDQHFNFPTGNLNSLSQAGEFVCNVSADQPLDEVMTGLQCVDIHKGLLEQIVSIYLGGSLEAASEQFFTQEEGVARRIQNTILHTLP